MAIALWRGKDQQQMDFKTSIQLFKSTKFRLVKNGLRAGRARGTVQDVSRLMQKRGFNPEEELKKSDSPSLEDMGKSASAAVGMAPKLGLDIDLSKAKRQSHASMIDQESTPLKELKHTFKPIEQFQVSKDPVKMLKEQAMNLEAVKKDESITEINLRSLVAMDMEPMCLLQAFQGSIIVTTNEYMTRDPQTFEGNTHLDDQQVMMF